MSIAVQSERFDIAGEISALQSQGRGGIATFIGTVRGDGELVALTIEHHPRITVKALDAIATDAAARWDLDAIRIVHRYGRLVAGEAIVFVGAVSAHRQDALAAVEFAIDRLKTDAPFWKREEFTDGSAQWVEARDSDAARSTRWG